MNAQAQVAIEYLKAKATKALDANGDGKVDAADLHLMAAIAEAGATKQTDSIVAKYGSLALFGAGAATAVIVRVVVRVAFGI